MKIAHIQWAMTAGGIENMLADIANEQAQRHIVVIFVINDCYDQFVLDKISPQVKVIKIGRKPGGKNPLFLLKLNYLLWRFKPDVIHTHQYRSINCIWYKKAAKVRTIHNTQNNCSEYSRFDGLISISKAVKDFTYNQGFESREIDNGIDVKRVKTEHIDTFRDGRTHIVQVGRLNVRQKGQDILILAVDILKNKFQKCDFVVHFIGEGEDASFLENMVQERQLENNVCFEGVWDQKKLYNCLCNFNLFIQPSRYEGFGLTVAEACAAKIPVIVSGIEGPLEIIDQGQLGFSFENENANDLAEKINDFLEGRYPSSYVEAAYRKMILQYDVRRVATQYEDFYQELILKKDGLK